MLASIISAGMNRTGTEKRAMIIRCLTEGNSIRSTVRLTGAAKNTVTKLVVEFGEFAAWYQDKMLRNLQCADVQLDEIWSFVGCREKNKETAKTPQAGDVWTWTAVCRDSKLVPCFLVSDRSTQAANQMVEDLASRLANRAQISTDGFGGYVNAMWNVFRYNVDYGRLIKVYGKDSKGNDAVIRADKVVAMGYPDIERVCTSHVERQNLTMRMGMRRFTRLTNGFSKKVENHTAMVAIHFLNYNFVRKHQSIKAVPAVAAHVIKEALTLETLLGFFDDFRAEMYPVKRPATYRKQISN